jgi:fumarate reductase (CoM/CoB) subunit B
MTVLDVALYIYENVDATFGLSYCCRTSHCGLCAAKINGKSGLMCREVATREMTLEPLDNLNVIRDLIVDRQDAELAKAGLRLFLDRSSSPQREPERILVADQQRFKVASRCVECYSCASACPVLRRGKHLFLGPANFVLLARHVFDPRDELDRTQIALSGGINRCESCAKCAQVCPHEINPAKTIIALRHKFALTEGKSNSNRTVPND